MTVHGDELARALAPWRGRYAIAADGYSPAATIGYALGEHVLVFGPGTSHARHDDILTDFRALDGRDILVVGARRPTARSTTSRTSSALSPSRIEVRGVLFHLIEGYGLRYPVYRDQVLDEMRQPLVPGAVMAAVGCVLLLRPLFSRACVPPLSHEPATASLRARDRAPLLQPHAGRAGDRHLAAGGLARHPRAGGRTRRRRVRAPRQAHPRADRAGQGGAGARRACAGRGRRHRAGDRRLSRPRCRRVARGDHAHAGALRAAGGGARVSQALSGGAAEPDPGHAAADHPVGDVARGRLRDRHRGARGRPRSC